MSVALIGYWIGPLRMWERALALAGGALLVFPGLVSDGIGIALMIVIAIMQLAAAPRRIDRPPEPERSVACRRNLILTGGHTHPFATSPRRRSPPCLPNRESNSSHR